MREDGGVFFLEFAFMERKTGMSIIMGNDHIRVSIVCQQGRLQLVEDGTLRLVAPRKVILWQVPQRRITQVVVRPGRQWWCVPPRWGPFRPRG